jgi:hypothetical protein
MKMKLKHAIFGIGLAVLTLVLPALMILRAETIVWEVNGENKVTGKVTRPAVGYTWPISAVSLPLPAGAATEATLQNLLDTVGTETQLADLLVLAQRLLDSTATETTALDVLSMLTNLRDGVATETTLSALDAKVTACDTTNLNTGLDTRASEATLCDIKTALSDYAFTDTVVEVTLTDTGTEYSYILPANCIGFEFEPSTDVAIRWAETTGCVLTTNYRTLKAGKSFDELSNPRKLTYAGKTFYFNCPSTADIRLEIVVRTSP